MGFEIILIKVDDLEKKHKEDYLMIWYEKERNNILTSSWKAYVKNLEIELTIDILNKWIWDEKWNIF